jgi:hypothetical protein
MAQVYPRIANPFMPNGTPDKTNSPTPFYAPGEIGGAFNDQSTGGSYLRVLLDSGATSATPVGAVAAGQIAYWKNRSQSLVTNDSRFADVGPSGAINRVAGIFQTAVSTSPGVTGTDGLPQQYVCDLTIQKLGTSVQAASALAGAQATVDTTANTARVVYTTGVNTAPVSQVVGTFTSSTITSNLATVDVNIGFVD